MPSPTQNQVPFSTRYLNSLSSEKKRYAWCTRSKTESPTLPSTNSTATTKTPWTSPKIGWGRENGWCRHHLWEWTHLDRMTLAYWILERSWGDRQRLRVHLLNTLHHDCRGMVEVMIREDHPGNKTWVLCTPIGATCSKDHSLQVYCQRLVIKVYLG